MGRAVVLAITGRHGRRLPEDNVPLPPPHTEVLTTCCDYCIVACGYKIYR